MFVGDLSSPYQPDWSAYVFSHAGWKPEHDQSYSTRFTNYVPLPGNFTNTLVLPNSVQGDLPYWTKVHHKTEYDAERAGHRLATPHYLDGDGVTTLHSTSNRGQLIQFGYPNPTSEKPEPFTSILPSMYAPIERITSHGQVEGADAILQVDVAHPAGPPLWAPVYVGNEVVLSGSAITIQGIDTCGLLPAGRPPISFASSATLIGTANFSGNPSTPQISPSPLDLFQQINALKKGAIPCRGRFDWSESRLSLLAGCPLCRTLWRDADRLSGHRIWHSARKRQCQNRRAVSVGRAHHCLRSGDVCRWE